MLALIASFDARVRREGDQEVLISLEPRTGRSLERTRLTPRALGLAAFAFMAESGVKASAFATLHAANPADPEQVINTLFGVLCRLEFGDYTPEPAVWRRSDQHRSLASRGLQVLIDEFITVAKADRLIRYEGLAGTLVETKPLSAALALPESLCLEHLTALADATREVARKDTRDFLSAAKYLAGSLSRYDHASYRLVLAELVALFRATERADEPVVNAPGPAAPAAS